MSSFLYTSTFSYSTRNNTKKFHKNTDFTDFIGSKNLRNFILNDTLLDWLEMYGALHNFKKSIGKDDFKSFYERQMA